MATSGALYPYVVVYAPDGSQEVSAYRHINQEMSQTGTYTVVIYDGDADSYGSDISLDDSGQYNFTFLNLDGCSWPSISCGQTLSGSIDAASDMDVWQFTASAGDRVLLSVMATSGALYPYVVVYAPDGSQEVSAYRHINQEMSQTGTYTVVIYDGDADSYGSDISLDDSGPYKISLTCGGTEMPDLAINAEDIQLLSYDAGDSTITIGAAIHNVGTAPASAVTVRFYEFNTLLGEAEVVEIPPGDTRSVPITIPMPAPGERLIQVVLDPLDTIK